MSLDDLSDEQLLEWFEGLLEQTRERYPGDPETWSYGDHPLQLIDLWGDPEEALWVVSIHGGYFAAEYDRTVNEPLCRRLAAEGMAVANIEYRRAGSISDPQETVTDVRAAIAAVVERAPQGARIVVTGHSAGGYLALTGGTHPDLQAVIPLAPVVDLIATSEGGWDEGALENWIGEPPASAAAASSRWARLQPDAIGISSAALTIVHGIDDRVVPVDLTRDFVGDHPGARLIELPGTGHYEFLDPESLAALSLLWEIRAS